MKNRYEVVVTALLVTCAVITTGFVVRHELFGASAAEAVVHKPVFLGDWKSYASDGITMGPSGAAVHIVEFADFECPFCAEMHQRVKNLRQQYPNEVSLTYVHFPLQGHRFAIPAARVAECANDQGRFEQMYDQLFDGQDQFGLKPWGDFATAAGVPDRAAFEACIKRADPIARVKAGQALGTKLDVQGTPTVIVNGWKLVSPPTTEEFDKMVRRILSGKNPVDSKA